MRSKRFRLVMFLLEVSDVLIGTRLVMKFNQSFKKHNEEYKPKVKKEVESEQKS